MTDLEKRIVKLLKTEGVACPPALIAFRMPTHNFDEIVISIRHLESQGVLRVESAGVELMVESKAAEEYHSADEIEPDTAENSIETRNAEAASNEYKIIAKPEQYVHETPGAEGPAKSSEALDLNGRIVNLLKKSGRPTPPSFITFQLPGIRLQEVTKAVSELKARGVVEIMSGGVQLTEAAGQNGSNDSIMIKGASAAKPPSATAQPHVNHSAAISSEPKPKQTQTPTPIPRTTEEERRRHLFAGMSNSEIDSFFETLQSNITPHSTTNGDSAEILLGSSSFGQEPSTDEPTEENLDDQRDFRPLRYSDSIDLLGLSTRTTNALGNNEFLTILDLALCESPDTVRGLGQLGIKEIHSSLKSHATPLGEAEQDRLASWYHESIPDDGLIFD